MTLFAAANRLQLARYGSDEEETLNRKVWRYDTEEIHQYSLAQVEEELLLLFPSEEAVSLARPPWQSTSKSSRGRFLAAARRGRIHV